MIHTCHFLKLKIGQGVSSEPRKQAQETLCQNHPEYCREASGQDSWVSGTQAAWKDLGESTPCFGSYNAWAVGGPCDYACACSPQLPCASNTLIQPPELGENKCLLFEPPGV